MAESVSMALADLLRKAEAEPDLDTLREAVRVMSQALMDGVLGRAQDGVHLVLAKGSSSGSTPSDIAVHVLRLQNRVAAGPTLVQAR